MVFNSLPFLFFFIAVFALYWSVPKKFQWCVLLASGYLFYGICSAEYLLLILLITAVSYLSALYLEKSRPTVPRFYLSVYSGLPFLLQILQFPVGKCLPDPSGLLC